MAAVRLSTKAVGSIVKIKVNGTARNFIIVHQGIPSNLYDSSCDGTWLLMEDIVTTMRFNPYETNNAAGSSGWNDSEVRTYLTNTFLPQIDTGIRNQIKTVKIPYVYGSGGAVVSGASGMSTKLFCLAAREIAYNNMTGLLDDGVRLSYFNVDNDARRIAKYNGTNTAWWTRSAYKIVNYRSTMVWKAAPNGAMGRNEYSLKNNGVRPAFILPNTLWVNDDGTVITNLPPTTPGAVSHDQPRAGKPLTITWAASIDPENDAISYIVERRTDGGTYQQIAITSALTATDTVPESGANYQVRVKAKDAAGNESAYYTGVTQAIKYNYPPEISGEDIDLGNVTDTGITYQYTVTNETEDDIDIAITLNGTAYQTLQAEQGIEQTLSITGDDWLEILNGSNQVITINATDGSGTGSPRQITFTKDMDTIDVSLGAQPIAVETRPYRIAVTISDEIPAGAVLTVLTCNNGLDDEPVWEDISTAVAKGYAHVFKNTELTANSWAVDVRILIQREGSQEVCAFSEATCAFEVAS